MYESMTEIMCEPEGTESSNSNFLISQESEIEIEGTESSKSFPLVAQEKKNGTAVSAPGALDFKEESSSFNASASFLQYRRDNYNKWSPVDEGVTLAWNDVYVYVQTKVKKKTVCKRIINGVTGAVRAGSLVAIMGSSGAGKSTLMAALAYRNANGVMVEGDILVNGRPIGNYMKYFSGFMHQDDMFVSSLTVLEHMHIMARLKMDRGITSKEIRSKIYELLKNLGLMKCLNTRIGESGQGKSLSGGEKKRLAFATELLTDPPILFCDEPTTGLDSFSAVKIITMMNSMALNGKTILCTIHQPSSDIFAMFNEIILLAEGRIAFMGTTANAVKFFDELGCKCPKSYNPADFLIKTLAVRPGLEESSKQAIKLICDRFAVSQFNKEVQVLVNYEIHLGRTSEVTDFKIRTNYKESFWWTKLMWLTRRWFIEVKRNPSVQLLKLIQKIVLGVLIGLCYYGTNRLSQNGIQSVMGAIFLLVSENTFSPMYAVLAYFPQDTPLFLREYKSGLYSPAVYYASRVLALLPLLILDPVIFVLMAYWLSGLRATSYAYFMSTFVAVVTMNVSSACGIFFSNAFDSVPAAMSYLVPFDYIFMITSGLFVKLSTLPQYISWTQYFSWLMYSTEALSILQWSGEKNITCEVTDMRIPCLTDGEQVLDKFSFSEDHLFRDIGVMIVLCCTFHILAFICLNMKAKR